MLNYEVTFIVDPVLSGDEIKSTAQTYEDMLKNEGVSITHIEEMGLRQLAYPINKKFSGVYYSMEFAAETGVSIPKMELALRRDERIMRFLTVRLDKYGVKYNQDKRDGKIGKAKKIEKKSSKTGRDNKSHRSNKPKPAPAKPKAAPAPAPVVAKSEEE
jgi:small subunit ribosomal protein S6